MKSIIIEQPRQATLTLTYHKIEDGAPFIHIAIDGANQYGVNLDTECLQAVADFFHEMRTDAAYAEDLKTIADSFGNPTISYQESETTNG